jgi:hypothetical protein
LYFFFSSDSGDKRWVRNVRTRGGKRKVAGKRCGFLGRSEIPDEIWISAATRKSHLRIWGTVATAAEIWRSSERQRYLEEF